MPDAAWARRLKPMLRARRFDETLWQRGDFVNDVFHVSVGFESSAAAIACAYIPGDTVVLTHRNHGILAAIGADLELMYREIFGRDGGPLRGRGGSLHLMDSEHGIMYTSAMVGGGVPVAIGMALAHQRLGREDISFAHFGDGAMEEGVLYESLNIAHYWDAPVVFVCDNDSSGPQQSESKNKITELARVCGIAARTVDASPPSNVVAALQEMVHTTRSGQGSQFLQIICPSWPDGFWSGHAPSHAQRNVTRVIFDILEAPTRTDDWSLVDPLTHEVNELLAGGVAVEDMLELDEDIRAEVERSVVAALAAELAPISVVDDDVWADK